MKLTFLSLFIFLLPHAFAQKPTNVVTTIGMIGNVIEVVGADCVAVTSIMGPGTDPHLYKASARDVQSFSRADIIFYSGYTLEGQLGDVLDRFAEQKPTVAVSPSAINPDELISVDSAYGIDPHLWMDVSLWAKIIPTITEPLSELNPDCADTFSNNANAYQAQLEALHNWTHEAIGSIPETQRLMVTAHDAFSYYGRAYNIEVTGIQGISTESEAGIADIRNMADLVIDRNVPAIFVESTINSRTVQAVVNAAKQSGHNIIIGEELYSDAMGETGTFGGTYIGMLYTNTKHITEALGGQVPPLPAELEDWATTWGVE